MGIGAGPFHRQQYRSTPFAADPNPLNEADPRQNDGAPDADRLISRNEAYGKSGDAGDQQCCDQGGLAADTVAVVPKDGRPDRASDETNGVDGEGLEHAHQRIGFGKEQFAEHQPGDDTVEEKIVPFDRRTDRAGDHGPT